MKQKIWNNRETASVFLSRAFLCLLPFLCLTLFSCRHHSPDNGLLPRPQPGYTAWLEKQSMAVQADKLISEISQTDRIWMFSGQGAPVDALLKAAPQWLELSSVQFPPKTFLKKLLSDFPAFYEAGVKGLYLGPLGEDQSYWHSQGKKSVSDRPLPASLMLDPLIGDEKILNNLVEAAEKAGFELGADIVSAETSMGPDFFLQARNTTGHTGLYAMLELPRNMWDQAPVSSSEWDGMALSPDQVGKFSAQGILPESLARDKREWGLPSGWAVTGEVMGIDGKLRRWLYRFEGDPKIPVFLWQDPSALARKVFFGAIIQQTGFWRLPLAGLRISALMGLEPLSNFNSEPDEVKNSSPGLDALSILADCVHRYGGWALQADPVPPAIVEAVLAGNCDFCREDITEDLVLKAIKSGNPSELLKLYNRWLKFNLDLKRLARGFNFRTAFKDFYKEVVPAGKDSLSDKPEGPNRDFVLMTLLSWRLGLPGLAFITPEELGINSTSRTGNNLLNLESEKNLKNILAFRSECSLAEGRLIGTFGSANSSMAVLSSLPEKGYWLLATNFSRKEDKISVSLPKKCVRAIDAADRKDMSHYLSNKGLNFAIPLDGHEARHVIFYMD